MTLDSWGFQVALGAVLLAVLALGIWRWHRFRWRRSERFGVLVIVQLLVLLFGFNMVNISGQYFGDWNDLAGSGSVAATERMDRTDPPNAFSGDDNDWRVTAVERAVDRARAAQSSLQVITLPGAATGYRLPAEVYLPGSYAVDSHRRYPVIELQAGYPGSARTWPNYLHLKSMLDTLIGNGSMPAVIAVSTTQNPRRGYDSECVDADPKQVPGSLAETYLTVDVPAFIRAHYRAGAGRVDWIDGGFSTGGFCAANLVLCHPRSYAGAVVLSGYFEPIVDHSTGPLYATAAERAANNPSLLIRRKHPPTAFFLGAAQNNADDMVALSAMQTRVPSSDPLRIVTTESGGHSGTTWRELGPTAFSWMAAVLAR